MPADMLMEALCDRCRETQEVFGGLAAEYEFFNFPIHLPTHGLRRRGWQAIPGLPLLCPRCTKENPMNPAAPSTVALALEHRAAPLQEIDVQIGNLELQLEHLHAARADADLATRQLFALKTFLDDLLTEPVPAWMEAAQAGQAEPSQAVALETVAVEAPAAILDEIGKVDLPAPETTSPESLASEDASQQPEDSALDSAPAPEPETAPQTPTQTEAQGELDEDAESESVTARVQREVVGWLGTHPGLHTANELCAALSQYPNVSKCLAALIREGQIQRTGEGGRTSPYQYFVPMPTPEPEEPTPEPAQTEAPPDSPMSAKITQESILAWFQTHTGEHTTAAVADAFDISSNSAGITVRLKKLWEEKELRRFGQGIHNDPFRYCLPSAVTTASVPVPVMPEPPKLSAAPVSRAAAPEVSPVTKDADRTKVLKELSRAGTVTAKTCAAATKLDQLVTEQCLEALCVQGEAQRISLIRAESNVRSLGYRVPRTNRESTEDLAVPGQLTQDESVLFTELRKHFRGAPIRTLLVKMQWNTPRLNTALGGLLRAGHIGRWGVGTTATYAALAPQAWQ